MNINIRKYRINKRTLFVVFTGLIVFMTLNILMLQTNYDLWTNPHVGFHWAFHRRFEFSGFDGPTYILVSKWRPLYELYRHPMLALMMWPLSTTNSWLMQITDTNCAIFIVAIVWTLMSTTSWVLLHKLINKIVGLGYWLSLLLCFFYFSIAYVTLATFVPDHMILSMTCFLLTLWLACKADMKGESLKTWQALVLTFFSMGIATTNCVKIWLIDMMSRVKRTTIPNAFRHSLLYFMPVLMVGGIYFIQLETTQKWDAEYVKEFLKKKRAAGEINLKKTAQNKKKHEQTVKKQVANIKIFEWTDVTIGRTPLLYENVFGEGFILHEDHLLKDANKTRPVFVYYRYWWYYAIEGIIVAFFIAGVWFGRKERLMWMLLAMVSVDAILHIGFRFAASDVYIMTAHWAFIIPISIAYLVRKTKNAPYIKHTIITTVLLVTIFLWWHNVSLISQHILN